MGIPFREIIDGVNETECYKKLVKERKREFGDRENNGTISTCNLGECTLIFDKYSKLNQKQAYNNSYENEVEGIANYIDLGVIGYELITIERKVIPYEPIYEMKYVILKKEKDNYIRTPFIYSNISIAKDKAIELMLDNPDELFNVSKEYVLVDGSDLRYTFIINKENFKEIPDLELKENQRLIEKHKYMFFGIALT